MYVLQTHTSCRVQFYLMDMCVSSMLRWTKNISVPFHKYMAHPGSPVHPHLLSQPLKRFPLASSRDAQGFFFYYVIQSTFQSDKVPGVGGGGGGVGVEWILDRRLKFTFHLKPSIRSHFPNVIKYVLCLNVTAATWALCVRIGHL